MNKRIKAKELKEGVSMVSLLSRLGYEPVKKTGAEHLYLSMLRDSDTTPSFSVNDKQGCWYDHGEGKGGNVIDFGLLYWPGLPFQEVLEKIAGYGDVTLPVDVVKRPKVVVAKAPNYEVLEVRDLGANRAITEYLQNRGIWLEAQGRLKEVYYYVEDDQKRRKHFFAAGWQNETGAWEVRSIYDYKGCLGHKGLSFIAGSDSALSVFEGFMDYLSWLSDNPFAPDSVLVLNSIAMLEPAMIKAASFASVSTYFDHDATGRNATKLFRSGVPQAVDRSWVYEGYNDYNDKLVAAIDPYQISR